MFTREFEQTIKENVELILRMPWENKISGGAWEFMVADAYDLPHVPKQILYDVIDVSKKIGWSVKTISTTSTRKITAGMAVDPIITRADIFKNCYPDLGYVELSMDHDPRDIGNAIIRYWNQKVERDAKTLELKEKKISVLVKNKNMTSFAYFEKNIDEYDEEAFDWNWVNGKSSLDGKYKGKDYWKFKWAPREHQLKEKWLIPKDALFFDLEIDHLTTNRLKELLEIK